MDKVEKYLRLHETWIKKHKSNPEHPILDELDYLFYNMNLTEINQVDKRLKGRK